MAARWDETTRITARWEVKGLEEGSKLCSPWRQSCAGEPPLRNSSHRSRHLRQRGVSLDRRDAAR